MIERALARVLRVLAKFRPPEGRADAEAIASELERLGGRARPAKPAAQPATAR